MKRSDVTRASADVIVTSRALALLTAVLRANIEITCAFIFICWLQNYLDIGRLHVRVPSSNSMSSVLVGVKVSLG